MKRVLTAVVLIPLVLLILFRAPAWLFIAFILLIALISTGEYLTLTQGHGLVPFRRLTFLAVATYLLSSSTHTLLREYGSAIGEESWIRLQAVGLLSITFPLWFLIRGLRRSELRTVLPGAAASAFALFYICLPFYSILSIRSITSLGPTLLFYLLVIVWAGDIAAYYVGRLVGRRKLAPRISPNKSWEGATASLVTSAALGGAILSKLLVVHFLFISIGLSPEKPDSWVGKAAEQSIPLWLGVLLSAGINIAAQLGDLVESMLKRGAALKDSGNLLPGHGGMLDRIDALLFAAPVLWYYATFGLIPF